MPKTDAAIGGLLFSIHVVLIIFAAFHQTEIAEFLLRLIRP